MGFSTLKHYKNMVPHWSVAKFFAEVEKLCNVIIDVDHVNKTVNIRDTSSYFSTNDMMFIPASEVIGEDEKKFDEDDELDMTDYTNVKYNLPETTQNKYRRISEEASALCTDVSVPVNEWQNARQKICLADIHKALTGYTYFLGSNYDPSPYYALSHIYKLTVYNQERSFVVWTKDVGFPILRMCDELADRITNDNKDVTELFLVPTEMISSNRVSGPNISFHFPMPFLRGKHGTFGGHRSDGKGANDIIKDGGASDSAKTDSTVPVAY